MPNPPSGEQKRQESRLFVWCCSDCGFYESDDGGYQRELCSFCQQDRRLERIEVVPASDLAALQSDLRIAREAMEWARTRLLTVTGYTDREDVIGIAATAREHLAVALQQLEAGQEQVADQPENPDA